MRAFVGVEYSSRTSAAVQWPPAQRKERGVVGDLAQGQDAIALHRMHFATDVLAGFASGTAWLAVCMANIELSRHYGRSGA